MSIIIRDCVPEDAAALTRINRKQMGYDYPEGATRAKLEKLLSRPGNRIFVADDGGKVVGYAHAAEYDVIYAPTMANLMGIAVDRDYLRRGIGQMLLRAVEQWAKEIGASGVRLVSGSERAQAHTFYEICGYKCNKTQLHFTKPLEGRE